MGNKFLLITYHDSLTNSLKQPTMIIRQTGWVDFISEFDFEVKHLKGMENQVAYALSEKVISIYKVSSSEVWTTFNEKIKEAGMQDSEYNFLRQQAKILNKNEQQLGYEVNQEGILIYRGRIYVPNQKNIIKLFFDEYHNISYARRPGSQKLITALRKEYLCPGMKKEVLKYLAHYTEWQQLKVEHRHPAKLLHPLPIPEQKWETISIDFITGLPKSKKKNDSIMVVVDNLSKYSHFIQVQ